LGQHCHSTRASTLSCLGGLHRNRFNDAQRFLSRVPDGPAAGQNNSRAQSGYDAYFGTYTVDDEHGTVTQRLLGALSKENVGAVLTRGMSVVGDKLVIRLQTTSVDGALSLVLLRGGGWGEASAARESLTDQRCSLTKKDLSVPWFATEDDSDRLVLKHHYSRPNICSWRPERQP
jgi:hypothetical protein